MNYLEISRRQANADTTVSQIKTPTAAATVAFRDGVAGGVLEPAKAAIRSALDDAGTFLEAKVSRHTAQGFYDSFDVQRDMAGLIRTYQSARDATLKERDAIQTLEAKLSAITWTTTDPSEAARGILLDRHLNLPIAPRIQAANGSAVSRKLLLEIGPEASNLPAEIFERLQQIQRLDGMRRVAIAQNLTDI
jgi:hypothetical protein